MINDGMTHFHAVVRKKKTFHENEKKKKKYFLSFHPPPKRKQDCLHGYLSPVRLGRDRDEIYLSSIWEGAVT